MNAESDPVTNYIEASVSQAAELAAKIEQQVADMIDAIMRKYAFQGVPVSTIARHAHSAVETARAAVVADPHFIGIVYDDASIPPLVALGPHMQGLVVSPQHVPIFKDTP